MEEESGSRLRLVSTIVLVGSHDLIRCDEDA